MTEITIETHNLTKIYDSNIVVDSLNIVVKKGELIGILGPNGAGKTSLIRMLSTILKPNSGTATIKGNDLLNDIQIIKSFISVVPQDYIFYEELTAEENLIFFGTMHGISKAELKTNSKFILNKLGLADRTDKTKNFSGGMKRRLNIAIALVMKPQVVFLDEPTAGLDPQIKHSVWNYIKDLRRDGLTMILTTHDMYEAEMLCDRVLIMDHGKIIAEGNPEELKELYVNKTILEIIFKRKEHASNFLDRVNLSELVSEIEGEDKNTVCISSGGGVLDFVKILQEANLYNLEEIESIKLRHATLEDVYLHLTGRRLER